jgi:uncharacterized membrane protein
MGPSELFLILLIIGVLLGLPLTAIILSILSYRRSQRVDELVLQVQRLEAQSRWLCAAVQEKQTLPTAVEKSTFAGNESITSPALRPSSTGVPGTVSATVVPESVHRPDQPAAPSSVAASDGRNAMAGTAMSPQSSSVPWKGPFSAAPGGRSVPADTRQSDPVGWESFIGQKAFGWVAALLFVLSASFFLKYAFQNNWVGPVGRVTIGELIGVALIVAGWRYLQQGMRRFSSMLTSTGIVVVYLASYSAFAVYQLIPQFHAGLFLAVLILESMAAAVFFDSLAVACVALLGGLLTPILLASDHDSYQTFFLYLILLNAAVALVLMLKFWRVIGSLGWAGTQLLFFLWYQGNFHPEKRAWAVGFQCLLLVCYLIPDWYRSRRGHTSRVAGSGWAGFILQNLNDERHREIHWENLARFVSVPILFFATFRILMVDPFPNWMGTAAVTMAILYVMIAKTFLKSQPQHQRLLFTSLAIAIAFTAWAIPVQADARWVSLGWAVLAAALWYFGLRITALPLRSIAGILAGMAVIRLLMMDLPLYTRDPFIPILNRWALPSLGVAVCLLGSVVKADRFLKQLQQAERFLIGVAGVAGITLVWLIFSLDIHGWFVSQALTDGDSLLWRWRGQLALTVFWTAFATLLLVLGFRLQRARLRWFAMILFGVTVLKLFVVDMANVQQLYRILAFFVLAVVLGLVARAYQRFR